MGHSTHPIASTSSLACAAVMAAAEGGDAADSASGCSVERRGGSRSTCPTRHSMILSCSEAPSHEQLHEHQPHRNNEEQGVNGGFGWRAVTFFP